MSEELIELTREQILNRPFSAKKIKAGQRLEIKCAQRGKVRDWFATTVRYISATTVVVDEEAGGSGEFVAHPATCQFRQIRTPEQIERERVIDEMYCSVATLNDPRLIQIQHETCHQLYAAGFRKGDQPKLMRTYTSQKGVAAMRGGKVATFKRHATPTYCIPVYFPADGGVL